jgi:hypothetical protein
MRLLVGASKSASARELVRTVATTLIRPDLQLLLIAQVRRPAAVIVALNLFIRRFTQYDQELVKRDDTWRHSVQELVVDDRQVGIGILVAPAFQRGRVCLREGLEPRGTDVSVTSSARCSASCRSTPLAMTASGATLRATVWHNAIMSSAWAASTSPVRSGYGCVSIRRTSSGGLPARAAVSRGGGHAATTERHRVDSISIVCSYPQQASG